VFVIQRHKGLAMAKLMFIKTKAGLLPHTEADKEVYDKWKLGGVISVDCKQVRNPNFHKRFFNLLNLAFDYYEPSSGVLTNDEKNILKEVFVELDNQSNNSGVLLDWGREFIKATAKKRTSQIQNIQNAFDPFWEDMVVQAGYYDEVRVPSGIKKVRRSISFAKMDEIEFNSLYKAVFNVCWRFVLSRSFKDEAEAQNAVDQLLSYTG